MSITNDVISIIRNNPKITAAEIKECAGITDTTVKSILWRLTDANRIKRVKVKGATAKGPRTVYGYYLGEIDGLQEKAREEVDAKQVTSSGKTNGGGSARPEIRQEGGYPPIYR